MIAQFLLFILLTNDTNGIVETILRLLLKEEYNKLQYNEWMNYYYYYLINIKLTDIIETITITYSLFETYNFSFHRL